MRLAWHFLPADGRLANGDGRPVVVGETLTVAGPLDLCHRGLHASHHVADALRYAPGTLLCRVRLGGDIVEGEDKLCATERTVEWMYDATPVLRRYARLCALDVVHLWHAPEVVVRYLRTGDEEIRDAAWAAAWDAARAAARDAAWAAWAAANAAARAAANAAARDAANAARDAANAAWDAAIRRQRARLTALVYAEARRLAVSP